MFSLCQHRSCANEGGKAAFEDRAFEDRAFEDGEAMNVAETADAVVVGGGTVGAWCAYFLRQAAWAGSS